MKKITSYRLKKAIPLIFFFSLTITVLAQVENDFSARFNETVNGDITMIANTIISRTPTQDYNEEDGNHDFTDNVYVDIDTDDSTFNSSNATFNNPQPQISCLSIRKVYLYWAAADKETDSNEDNQPNWNFNDVKIMLPGETIYNTITADEVLFRGRDTHFGNDPYICVKDITASVLQLNSPYGKYQVANIEAKTGGLISHQIGIPGTSGGWQIVYVYESPELATKNISLFDGYAHITKDLNNFDIDFDGFLTVPEGPVNANIVIGSLEGDRDLLGDQLQIVDTQNNFINLSAPQRPVDNFFNSRITVGTTNFLDRTPASLNTLGFDATVFKLDNPNNSIIGNNQSSAKIRLTSNQETYGLYLIGLSVEVWSPNLYPIKLRANIEGNITNASDAVMFDFNFLNTGNDDAINVVLSTTLPTNLEFLSANNLPNGVSYSYDPNTRLLEYYLIDGLADVGDPLLNLNFEVRIKEECYFLEERCDLSFEMQLKATYNGVENPRPRTTLSSYELDDCQLGTLLPVVINQPAAALWVNPPGDLDRILNCDNFSDLNTVQNLFPVPDKCDFNLTKTNGSFVPNNTCGNSGTYTNSWVFTDACGRTITDYIQVITIVDDSPPVFSSLPNDIVINCSETPEFTQAIVEDSCSFNIDLSFNDVTTSGSCDGDFTITRTWTAIDDCGNVSTASQSILAQDTSPPNLVSALDTELIRVCEIPPEIPELEFSDNCSSNLSIIYEEETQTIDAENYDILRSWTVYDECANQNTFIQTIHMRTNHTKTSTALNLCPNDNAINLNHFVEVNEDGYWENEDLNILNNNLLNPSTLVQGEYTFNYIVPINQCIQTNELVVIIGETCIELDPCISSSYDVNISKLVTPNGDLKNQTFMVSYNLNPEIDFDQRCEIIVKLKMFNRWGSKVFESNDYDNSWTGTSGGGFGTEEKLPSGTYYYVITLENSGLKPIQGYILLGIEQ